LGTFSSAAALGEKVRILAGLVPHDAAGPLYAQISRPEGVDDFRTTKRGLAG
jgi:hypothetical protein